jgi:hypothetical protein
VVTPAGGSSDDMDEVASQVSNYSEYEVVAPDQVDETGIKPVIERVKKSKIIKRQSSASSDCSNSDTESVNSIHSSKHYNDSTYNESFVVVSRLNQFNLETLNNKF